jgi:hypothetical protein
MAPTEILARQHAETLAAILQASRVRHCLLAGGLTSARRDQALADIAARNLDLVIGTHAVISQDVRFTKLGLVVVDEQHKFGVRQRAALRRGNEAPHYLVMTATPIPRTVSMTLFGDLDVTLLREMPPGRQPVSTYLVSPDVQPRWWHFVRDKLRAGRQAYVVAPLVDESENVAAASVADAFERLTNGELAAFRAGIVHGRMSAAEKESGAARSRVTAQCSWARSCRRRRKRAWPRSRRPTTAFAWPSWISSSAGRATCSARSSTACRRCGLPTCAAIRSCSPKRAPQQSACSRLTRAWFGRSTRSFVARC